MTDIYEASDYAGIEAGDYKFYYGYEWTFCPRHHVYGLQDSSSCCYDNNAENDCDNDIEWCFVATKAGKQITYYPKSKLEPFAKGDTMAHYLMAGIAVMLQDGLLETKEAA